MPVINNIKLTQYLKTNIHFQTFALCVVVFLLLIPFVYKGGAGEADSSYMVGAIYQVSMDPTPDRETMYYMHSGQPLYNWGLNWLIRIFGLSFDSFLSIANHLAALSTAITAAALYYICRKMAFGFFSVVLGVVVYLSAPYTIELATYSHPQTISIALIMVSIAFGFNFLRSDMGWKARFMYFLPSAITGIAGLLCRMDGAILYSMLLALIILDDELSKVKKISTLTFPAIILLLSILIRPILVSQNTSASGSDLLKLLLQFSDTEITVGLSRIPITLGIGSIFVLIIGFIYSLIKDDYKSTLAASIIIIPTTYYCCQNALVPRRFIHLFIVAGFATAIYFRKAYTDAPAKAKNQTKKKKQHINKEIGFQYPVNLTVVFALTICLLNWFLPTVFYKFVSFTGGSYPNTVIGNGMKRSIFSRHISQQKYYNWLVPAYQNMVSDIYKQPHDIIGSWGDYGELFSAFSRKNIQLSVTATPAEGGKPGVKTVSANNIKHAFYSPPWDIPPGQKNPQVVLLNNYGDDVKWGLRNIKITAPPNGIIYSIW